MLRAKKDPDNEWVDMRKSETAAGLSRGEYEGEKRPAGVTRSAREGTWFAQAKIGWLAHEAGWRIGLQNETVTLINSVAAPDKDVFGVPCQVQEPEPEPEPEPDPRLEGSDLSDFQVDTLPKKRKKKASAKKKKNEGKKNPIKKVRKEAFGVPMFARRKNFKYVEYENTTLSLKSRPFLLFTCGQCLPTLRCFFGTGCGGYLVCSESGWMCVFFSFLFFLKQVIFILEYCPKILKYT